MRLTCTGCFLLARLARAESSACSLLPQQLSIVLHSFDPRLRTDAGAPSSFSGQPGFSQQTRDASSRSFLAWKWQRPHPFMYTCYTSFSSMPEGLGSEDPAPSCESIARGDSCDVAARALADGHEGALQEKKRAFMREIILRHVRDASEGSGDALSHWKTVFSQWEGTSSGLRLLLDLADDAHRAVARSSPCPTRDALRAAVRDAFRGEILEPRVIAPEDAATLSPEMLRLLAKGEAVHPVDDPEHLLRRLGPDGRLLVLAHPALPDVPIVQLWGAFYRGLPHTLASLQERASPDSASDAEADTLVLYSISSCRPSVSGGGLGQQLIKFACNELGGREGPRLKAIATLSPIPMFREWVVRTVEAHRRGDPGTTFLGSTSALEELLHRELWHTTQPTPQDEAMFWEILHKQVGKVWEHGPEAMEKELPGWAISALVRLAQVYISQSIGILSEHLGEEADMLDLADAVSRFHTRNGADVVCVHWMANTSRRGLDQSLGIMASYLYRGSHEMFSLCKWSWHPVGHRSGGIWKPLGHFTGHEA